MLTTAHAVIITSCRRRSSGTRNVSRSVAWPPVLPTPLGAVGAMRGRPGMHVRLPSAMSCRIAVLSATRPCMHVRRVVRAAPRMHAHAACVGEGACDWCIGSNGLTVAAWMAGRACFDCSCLWHITLRRVLDVQANVVKALCSATAQPELQCCEESAQASGVQGCGNCCELQMALIRSARTWSAEK